MRRDLVHVTQYNVLQGPMRDPKTLFLIRLPC